MNFINRIFLFQSLNENRIYSGKGFLITIDTSETETNFRYDPYLKVYPNEGYNKNDEVARIHFLKNYRYEKAHKGKRAIEFNNKDLKIVCELIKNNWEKILTLYTDECNITGLERDLILKTKYPEDLYNSLKR